MKMHMKTSVAILAFALTACGDTTDFRNNSNFGYATTQNALVQTGSGLQELNSRFNQDVQTLVNFDFNSTVLDAEARAILDQQARFINGFPMIRFRVYGHTDLVGSESFNKGLGLRRAQAVVSYLASRGVSRSRLEALITRGKSEPLVNTQNPERLNRRAITQVAGFSSGYDGSEFDGKRAMILYDEYVKGDVAVEEATATSTSQ
jgi:peptidoglycan-associated lipoprotein